MKSFDQLVMPLSLVVIAAICALLADRAAAVRRRPGGDRGDFWARIVQRTCMLLGIPVLISGVLAFYPKYWPAGRHLHFDLTGAFGWSTPFCYRVALLLPFAVWGLLLLIGIAQRPGGREAGRWLAGAIDSEGTRKWILIWTIPLAIILISTLSDLGIGKGGYPAATWGMLAVLLLSLFGVAWSAGDAPLPPPPPGPVPGTRPQRTPWPQALAGHGVRLRHVATWQASEGGRQVRPSARHLVERLRLRGAEAIAPELIEAVDDLFGPVADEKNRNRLMFAPDGCGQAEVVALAAELLDQRSHAATLVVTAGDPKTLAAELRHWVSGTGRVAVVEPSANSETDALIVVVDAQVLSDRLLPQLKDPLLLKRFGLIVWWQLEAYTGVLAANLWAISRRLHRLLQSMGRHDVRTLAFIRSAPHGDAQLGAFVRRLLPHPLPVDCERQVAPRFPRELQLHLLQSHEQHFAGGAGRDIQGRQRHLPLVAARVSVEENWSTYVEVPAEVSAAESAAFLQLPAGNLMLRDRLEWRSAAAGAEVRGIQPGEVLSLIEIIRHGGRTAEAGLPHHVGITLPPNPYVAHLLSTLPAQDGDFGTSRRLVSAAAHASVIRRHLLLALDELPDTRSGLLRNFFSEEVVGKTLDDIAGELKLTRNEVRFIDEHGELRRDHEYKSQVPPTGDRRPLDTVGASLIEVRDTAGALEPEEGVMMRVDPERLTIQAYPHRVFLHNGQRYRIREWDSVQKVLSTGRLECEREGVLSLTWRIRNPSVFGIEPATPPANFGSRNRIARLTASLTYQEDLFGALWVTPDLTTGIAPPPAQHQLARPLTQSFATRALLLRLPEEDAVALASVAQALRHVLPVHLGCEEDALEVVPLTGELMERKPVYGLAIVDLYPGGIGLIDAIADDNPFLLQLLEWSHEWLDACSCASESGCEQCLRSAAAQAANMDQLPLRGAAINLLRQVM